MSSSIECDIVRTLVPKFLRPRPSIKYEMGNKHAKSRKQAKVAIAPQFEKTEQVCLAAVEKCVEGNQGKADTSPEQSDEVGDALRSLLMGNVGGMPS